MTGAPPDASVGETKAEVDPLIGRTIAQKFAVEALLGAGAMGAVYKARQVALDRPVAIKVMHRQLEADAAYAARFDREAKAASRLDHPNLIRILDYGREPDGLFYIAMEFLDGQDLFQVMQNDWPLSPARIVDLLAQTLAGLAAAHDEGILHRDLKPENIMLLRRKTDDGKNADLVKVCDFGIAKLVDARISERPPSADSKRERKLSTAGFVVGTPEFMSPEQAHGEELDRRSDLYSIGIILYQLLTGRLPFEAETALGVVLKLLHDDPVPPSQIVPSVDLGLEAICLKAISKQKTDRFVDARDMRAALREIATSAAGPTSVPSVRKSIANAPTMDFVPPTSSRATASLSAIAVPPSVKPRTRKRIVLAAIAAIAAISLPIAFHKHLHLDANANEAPAASLVTTEAPAVSVAATDVTTSAANAPTPLADSDPIAKNEKRHERRDFGRKKIPTSSATVASAETSDPPPSTTTATPMIETIAVTPPPTPNTPTTPPPHVATTAAPPPTAVFDPSSAHVDIGTPRSTGTTPGSVMRALAPIGAKISACYRVAVTATAAASSAMLHLQADEDGFITDAHLTGAPPVAAGCIEALVRGRKIPDVDTGNANADVPLALRPR